MTTKSSEMSSSCIKYSIDIIFWYIITPTVNGHLEENDKDIRSDRFYSYHAVKVSSSTVVYLIRQCLMYKKP